MKKYSSILLPCILLTMGFAGLEHAPFSGEKGKNILTDSLPDICSAFTPQEIAAIHPFTNLLTNSFPDPNNYETYSGCYYQFYTANDKPQIAVKLLKWGSKKEAAEDYHMQVQRHFESWGITPERITGVADSAYFSLDNSDTTFCDECGLVAIQGVYSVYISFKGQYDKVPRARKKQSALLFLQFLYDRIPGLAPSRIRNQ